MYAWDRGQEKQNESKAVYVLKKTGEVCFVDFVSSDRQASSFIWPNKLYLGEVFDSCVSMACWDNMSERERDNWITRARGTQ